MIFPQYQRFSAHSNHRQKPDSEYRFHWLSDGSAIIDRKQMLMADKLRHPLTAVSQDTIWQKVHNRFQ